MKVICRRRGDFSLSNPTKIANPAKLLYVS
jgi:hypothetical protein